MNAIRAVNVTPVDNGAPTLTVGISEIGHSSLFIRIIFVCLVTVTHGKGCIPIRRRSSSPVLGRQLTHGPQPIVPH